MQHNEHNVAAEEGAALSPDKHNAVKILSQYFGVPNYQSAFFPADDIRASYSLHFLIATVPDPVDSRLPYLFDRFVGSIERAAEADDFMLDRFDLPWIEELNKKQTATNSSDSSDSVSSKSSETHDYQKEPGYILFRRPINNKRSPQLLLVFIVGETPTAGIHKEALLSALHQIDVLSSSGHQKNERIKILGPTFSGSAESLRTVLVNWLQKSKQTTGTRRIHIVSGSATAVPTEVQNFASLTKQSDNAQPYYFDLSSAGADVVFETTVITDAAALHGFFDYLSRKHEVSQKGAIRVGLLTEANTSYGNSLQQMAPKFRGPFGATKKTVQRTPGSTEPPGNDQSETAASGTHDAESEPDPCSTNPYVSLTALPFPLHISQLRSELERSRQQGKTSDQAAQTHDTSKYLPVPFDDESSESTDSIPPFSQLEAPTAELVLSNLLSTLSQEHFDYVGVAASDVRDTIFLAREVREHSPSSVIFSLNADLLYAHPEANPNTRGMLVVTPYPLFTMNQVWTKPPDDRPRLQFPDQNSEGVYNAMLLLISGDRKLLEYGVPFRGISDSQVSSTAERFQEPPLWLTTVGRGGFWPVALLSDRCSSSRTHHIGRAPEQKGKAQAKLGAAPANQSQGTTPTQANSGDVAAGQSQAVTPTQESGSQASSTDVPADYSQGMMPHGAILVFFVWSCLCAIPAVAFLWQEFRGRSTTRPAAGGNTRSAIPRFLSESIMSRNRSECHTYFLAGGIALLSAYIVALAALRVSSFQLWEFSVHTCLFLMMVAVAVLTFCACLLLAWDALGLPIGNAAPRASNLWLWAPVLVVGLLGFGFAVALARAWLLARFQPAPDTPFAVNGIVIGYRALNLSSGVSPLIPIFLIALAACAWAISAVRRVRLTESLPWTITSQCDGREDEPCSQDGYSLFNSKKPSFSGFAAIEEAVQKLLRAPSLHLPDSLRWVSIVAASTVGAAVIYLFYCRLVEAFESPIFYLFFGLCFLVVYLSIVFNTLRLLFLWLSLSRLLRNIERHPLRRAFPRFYKNYPNLPRINLASAPPSVTALSFSVEQAQELRRSARGLLSSGFPLASVIDRVAPEIGVAALAQQTALAAETVNDCCQSLIAQLSAQRALARASCHIEDALSCIWNANTPVSDPDDNDEKDRRKLADQAEEFLVGRTVLFLSHIFPQMTNLAGLSLASLLLLLMAVSSYPFQPHQLIVLFSWVIIFAFVAVALFMSVQMNRDTLLSNLNGTKPGELNWDREFVSRILLYVVIPILGFLGVQFPDTIAQLFSFLSPGASGHG
jgi:hypothetical protein